MDGGGRRSPRVLALEADELILGDAQRLADANDAELFGFYEAAHGFNAHLPAFSDVRKSTQRRVSTAVGFQAIVAE